VDYLILIVINKKTIKYLFIYFLIITVEDLRENVEYTNYTAESKIIIWLWELLHSYDKSKRAAFL
jgi:hypothetical protein